MDRFDIAIIGTGPAGLEAAITASIRNKKILLLGSKNLSDKVEKGHLIRNYLGLPDISGTDLSKRFNEHLDSFGIDITEDRITAVYSMGDYFSLQGSSGSFYESETVIIATGVMTGKVLDGESEYLGNGVSYCATCDAPLYRKKAVAVICYSKHEESEADFLSEIAGSVDFFPMFKEDSNVNDSVKVVSKHPVSIKRDNFKTIVTTSEGNTYSYDGVFVLRDSIAPSNLVPGLLTEGAHIVCDRNMKTNIDGCFACGDITGLPYQYIKSAGEGNIAALSACAYIDSKKRNSKQ
ncbi:MAG: NAD(P)/FAD-dependent oxidoreductase [Clostridiales bacterium]|nr:NAD(P)/FAD-dependent oxidoreductase [Clostridiales bacterium]